MAADWELELIDRAALSTVIESLSSDDVDDPDDSPLTALSFQTQHNDVGAVQGATPRDHAFAAAVQGDRLLRVKVRGTAAACYTLSEPETVVIAPNGEVDEVSTFSGAGHLAITAEAPVNPANGTGSLPVEQTRVWDWTAPGALFDDSAWSAANAIESVDAARVNWPLLPFGQNFIDGSASVLFSTGATYTSATVGPVLFREEFTVSATAHYAFQFLIDNYGTVYVDGILLREVNSNDGFTTATKMPLDLTAGTHTLAVYAYNANVGSPGGAAWALFKANGNDEITDLTPVYHSTSSAKVLDYPAAFPGMTVGRAVRLWVEESQGSSLLQGVTLGFTDDEDSNGETWDDEYITTSTGNDGLTFLREIAASFADVAMNPASLELNLYKPGTRGSDLDVSLHDVTDEDDPDSGNIAKLTYKGAAKIADALLVQTPTGWSTVAGFTSGVHKQVTVSFGDTLTADQVNILSILQMAAYQSPRAQIVVDPIVDDETPDAEYPFVAFRDADRIWVPESDGVTPVREKLLAITGNLNTSTATIDYTYELKDLIADERERTQVAIKKMANGSVTGTAMLASQQHAPSGFRHVPIQPVGVQFVFIGGATTSQPWTADRNGALKEVFAKCGSGSFDADVKQNGSTIASITGDTTGAYVYPSGAVTYGDAFEVVITASTADVPEVQMRFVPV